MRKFQVVLAAALLAAGLGGGAAWVWLSRAPDCGGTVVAGGKAAIGGPFTLVDATGATVTDKDVIDRPALIYFGYTSCPDVCPVDVSRNATAADLLAEKGYDVKPVFISVDPARDTPEVMGAYAEAMSPKMVGLTGTPDQVKAAADAYKVYFARGPGDGDTYEVNHTSFTYLMFPATGLGTYFSRQATAEEIAQRSACLIRRQSA